MRNGEPSPVRGRLSRLTNRPLTGLSTPQPSTNIFSSVNDDRDDLVTVGVFGHADEAALARNRLESVGIKAVLGEENSTSLGWALTGAHGGIKLLVARADEQTARYFLEPDETATSGIMTSDSRQQLAREDEDTLLSPREKQATRALKSSHILRIFCAAAAGLLRLSFAWRVHFRQTIDRLAALTAWGAGIVLGIIVAVCGGVCRLLVHAAGDREQDRLCARRSHPEILGRPMGAAKPSTSRGRNRPRTAFGRWMGALMIRATGAWDVEATGSWGFDHFSLLIHPENVTRGVDSLQGKIGGWEMEKSPRDEMLLRDGNRTLRMVRQ